VVATNSASAFGDPLGVAEVVAADNDWFWAVINGKTTVNVATSCAANVELNTTATVGRLDDDASVGAEVAHGIALNAAESSNAALAWLSFPTVGATL